MHVVHHASELPARPRRTCVAIGFFDGVHLGHQQIIRQTLADAQQHEAACLVVTFDRHPNSVVAPDRVPPLIQSLPQRTRSIADLGADNLWLIHFDRAFSEQTGEQFVRQLVRDFGPVQRVCVGADFAFGHKRSGDVALLKTLGKELNFAVHGMAAIALDGQVVSSTRIREAIRKGDLDAASQMLGRAYALAGEIQRGDGLGRQMGVPTANLNVTGLVLPPNGVYAIHARSGKHVFRGVMNIGVRPTLSQPEPRLQVEAHLFDFDGDLYGQELEVTPVARLREEKRFPSLAALREQIGRDMEAARREFE